MESLWWTAVAFSLDQQEDTALYYCWETPEDVIRLRQGWDVEWVTFTTVDAVEVSIRAETVGSVEVSRERAVDLNAPLEPDVLPEPRRGSRWRRPPRRDQQMAGTDR